MKLSAGILKYKLLGLPAFLHSTVRVYYLVSLIQSSQLNFPSHLKGCVKCGNVAKCRTKISLFLHPMTAPGNILGNLWLWRKRRPWDIYTMTSQEAKLLPVNHRMSSSRLWLWHYHTLLSFRKGNLTDDCYELKPQPQPDNTAWQYCQAKKAAFPLISLH